MKRKLIFLEKPFRYKDALFFAIIVDYHEKKTKYVARRTHNEGLFVYELNNDPKISELFKFIPLCGEEYRPYFQKLIKRHKKELNKKMKEVEYLLSLIRDES